MGQMNRNNRNKDFSNEGDVVRKKVNNRQG